MVRNGTIQLHLGGSRRFGFTAPSMAALGALAAWIAVVIYAASNSIVTLLVDIGAANPVEGGRNAITYTNLYVLGSLLSLGPMALLYRRDLTRTNFRALSPRHWRLLGVSAVLSSVITPGLFFYALEHTTVTNVVLVGRIEPPLFLLATWFFLRERLDPWALFAGLTALGGAIVIIGTGGTSGMFSLGKGEVATIFATLSFIASTIVTRAGLRDVPIGIFAIFRTVIGVTLYFALVSALFGFDEFQDVLDPIVWSWVWVYAVIVLVFGQIAWNFGLKHARAGDVALATSFSPLAAIMIAMLLLGENPGPGLIPGAALILVAIAIGHLGRASSDHTEDQPNDRSVVIRPQWESPGWMHNHAAVQPARLRPAQTSPPGGPPGQSPGWADPNAKTRTRLWHEPPALMPPRRCS